MRFSLQSSVGCSRCARSIHMRKKRLWINRTLKCTVDDDKSCLNECRFSRRGSKWAWWIEMNEIMWKINFSCCHTDESISIKQGDFCFSLPLPRTIMVFGPNGTTTYTNEPQIVWYFRRKRLTGFEHWNVLAQMRAHSCQYIVLPYVVIFSSLYFFFSYHFSYSSFCSVQNN